MHRIRRYATARHGRWYHDKPADSPAVAAETLRTNDLAGAAHRSVTLGAAGIPVQTLCQLHNGSKQRRTAIVSRSLSPRPESGAMMMAWRLRCRIGTRR